MHRLKLAAFLIAAVVVGAAAIGVVWAATGGETEVRINARKPKAAAAGDLD